MSCMFRHKWSEWSEVKIEKYAIFNLKTNASLGTRSWLYQAYPLRSWLYQERVCEKCKKLQRKSVDNYMTKGA